MFTLLEWEHARNEFTEDVNHFDDEDHMGHVGEFSFQVNETCLSGDHRTFLVSPKRGKGQKPILVGAIYRGKYEHVAFKAGGNDKVQIQVAKRGVSTSSEKYTVVNSANTQVRFIAVTWDSIPQDPDLRSEESDDANYRSSARNWQPPPERSD